MASALRVFLPMTMVGVYLMEDALTNIIGNKMMNQELVTLTIKVAQRE